MIIESFSRKFAGPDVDLKSAILKLSQLNIYSTSNFKMELSLFCRIAEELFTREDVLISPLAVSNFATMLLAMIRTYTTSKKIRVEEEWLLNVLRVYRTLIWRMDDVSHHVAFVSRLFGPTANSFSLLNASAVRSLLSEVRLMNYFYLFALSYNHIAIFCCRSTVIFLVTNQQRIFFY